MSYLFRLKNRYGKVSWQIAKDVRKLNRELGCGIAGICCAAFPICLVKEVTVICHFYISRKVIMSKPDVFLPKYNAIVIHSRLVLIYWNFSLCCQCDNPGHDLPLVDFFLVPYLIIYIPAFFTVFIN